MAIPWTLAIMHLKLATTLGVQMERDVPDGVSQDEMKQPILVNEDAEYCKYLAKFFKGEK